jgi:hypothetical protein
VFLYITEFVLDIAAHILTFLWGKHHHHRATGQHTTGKGQKITDFHNYKIKRLTLPGSNEFLAGKNSRENNCIKLKTLATFLAVLSQKHYLWFSCN